MAENVTSSHDSKGNNGNNNRDGILGRVKQSAAKQLTTQKDRAADGVGSVTKALRQSTQHLRDEQHDTIAQYVEQAADQIDSWCNSVRAKDVTQVLDDVQQLAKRQPALFIGSAFALGVLGARFLKSSGDNGAPRRSLTSAGSTTGRAQYRGETMITEAADAPSTATAVLSDVESSISRPAPGTAAPAPGGGAGASTRTRRTATPSGNKP